MGVSKFVRSPLTTGDGIRFGCGFAIIQVVVVLCYLAAVVVFAGSM